MEFLDHTGEKDNIWTASSNGDLERVKELLASGENKVDDQDENGYSAIHAAASYGHMDLLEFLVNVAKANVRLRDVDGDEPIHVCELPVVFDFLVDHGADPMAVNDAGEDLFAKSVEDENEEMVNYLISKGLGQASERLPQFEFREDEHAEMGYFEEADNEDDEENESDVEVSTSKAME